jgi:hypothetical protein
VQHLREGSLCMLQCDCGRHPGEVTARKCNK